MAKFYGSVGYADTVETAPGVYEEQIVEYPYYGDLTRNTRQLQSGETLNDDINIANEISIVQLLKALGIEHTDEVIHAGVVDGDDAEDRPFPFTQRAEVHIVPGGHCRILRDVKRRQTHSGRNKDGFCRLAGSLFEHLVLLYRNMVGLFLLQRLKEQVQRTAVALVLLSHLGVFHHEQHGFKILFLRWGFAHEVEHQGGVQSNLGL